MSEDFQGHRQFLGAMLAKFRTQCQRLVPNADDIMRLDEALDGVQEVLDEIVQDEPEEEE